MSKVGQRPEDCLAGGGAMGELMRSTDWSKTVFGPVEKWPQSLRTAISIMLESRFAMVVAWGPEFRFFYNDGYRPILGSKHPMALGTPGQTIFPEVWPVVGPEFERVRRGEAFAIDDWLLPLDRNGYLENCWFTLSYSPIRDETGGVGGLLAVVAETTGRVESERRLATLRELARRAAETKTADDACQNAAAVLVQNPIDVPFAIFYLLDAGAKQARRVASVGFEEGSGANPPVIDVELSGGAWPLKQVIATGDTEVLDNLSSRFAELPGGPYPEAVHTALLLPLSRPGREHPYGILVAGVSPRRAIDERYRSFFELAADHVSTAISNAMAFEAERRRAEALAEIDKAKTTFFSNVSHEFRTPLTLMLGPTEDALRQPGRALTGESLETVHRNALRLLKLVNSVLDFSRIEAGRIEAVYEPTDLMKFTGELVSGFRSAVERAGLQLRFIAPSEMPAAFVDRRMWEKIVLNLLSNAFKFTFEGEITVALEISGGMFRLRVSDTGVGIPETALPRVFDRFHRIEGTRARTHEGSGIGLALVQELVRLHGGEIDVNSRLDSGSTFTVSIPMGSAHLPADRIGRGVTLESNAMGIRLFAEEASRWIPLTAGITADTDPEASAGRILIADDNADMRDYLVHILSPHWNVEAAADGEQALAKVRQYKPDVILTDVMMPGLDGFALLKAIRTDPVTQNIRIIMLSARAGEEARVEGLRAGADDYLVKPFNARELTARVNSQIISAKAHKKMSAHRNELYSLFMQSPAPICVFRGKELRFEMANDLYLKVAGRKDILGKTLLDVFPEVRGLGIDELLLGVIETGEPFVAREMLVPLDRGQGLADTWFTFIYAPLANADGIVDRVMCFCNEVTDQVIARHAAENANRSKDEFLAALGHELRNPLAPIVSALHVMKQRDDTVFAIERGVIERQVRHMVRLVDDLLDIARIATGKIELRRKPVEIAEIVNRALDMAKPLLEQRAQSLSVEVPATGLQIDADEVRMAQVVSNLLTNASKFTGRNGQIFVKAAAEADRVVFTVKDTGKGIPPDLLPSIFDIFTQGDRSTEEGRAGIGLGLSIVKSIVDLHAGQVTARSQGEGKGSEFEISLPLVSAQSSNPAGAQSIAAAQPKASKRQRILVVDDNPDGAEVLAITLRLEGHDVQIALDGPTALDMAREFEPTVVLLDIGLPVIDGYEVARRLRATPGGPAMRIAAVSGYGLESDFKKSAAAGFDLHLVKPLDFSALESVLG